MNLNWLRKEIIGSKTIFNSPYGKRLVTYADYTASGRNLAFIEEYLLRIQENYANTHTEDGYYGEQTTMLYHKAKDKIRKILGANEEYVVFSTGNGATGAFQKLSQILGIYEAPATRERYKKVFNEDYKKREENRPVIFVGPYEHHSNEILWKEGLAEVIEISLTEDGKFDTADLEEKVSDAKYAHRQRIGSFSAASNVTGMISPIDEVTRIMHRYGGLVFFDYAASGPYVEIDVNREGDLYFDGIVLSPHKFIGGPGAAGLLVIRKDLYNGNLPPTVAGGGTVEYVSSRKYDFEKDIETREDAGTPGVLQTIKAALALEVKKEVGYEFIQKVEEMYIRRVIDRLDSHENIEIIGPKDRHNRIGILSFNIKFREHYLHPRYITRLMNDLFGIQSRAGCSCAGPYGHLLLGIDIEKSEKYRQAIKGGCEAMKPGWVRINFHYLMDETMFQFIVDAILFIADYGYLFLEDYEVDCKSGKWEHIREKSYHVAKNYFLSLDFEEVVSYEGYHPQEYDYHFNELEYVKYMTEAQHFKNQLLKKEKQFKLYKSKESPEIAWFYVEDRENKKI